MSTKKLLVIGGSGNLGRAIVSAFRPSWQVASIDFSENKDSHFNFILKQNSDLQQQLPDIKTTLTQFSPKFASIVCVAGGFGLGNIASPNILSVTEHMFRISLHPSLLAGHLATDYLDTNGFLGLTGAAGVIEGKNQYAIRDYIVGYSLAKTSVLHLADYLKECNRLPKDSKVFTINPTIVDTPQNRGGMPNADFSKWLKPEKIAQDFFDICNENIKIENGYHHIYP